MGTCVVEPGSDDEIGILKPDSVDYKRLHRVPGVWHRFKVRDNAFDYLRSIIEYRVNGPSIIYVGPDETRRGPEKSKAKKKTREPFLHPRRRRSKNTNSDKDRKCQAHGDEDEPECWEGPLSVTHFCDIEDSRVTPRVID
jgi:hypothetical protein